MSTSPRPVCVLIAALGGEGGGVLTGWIVQAATACGLPVQSTSIPGVAQRTGATTYYLEVFPQTFGELDGADPVMGLYPAPGRVDLMVASEILEAARAMENGFVSPDRTTLISSSHRVYAISEKSDLGDGRYDQASAVRAAGELARESHCGDFQALARQEGSALNAVLLGVIARSGRLPISDEAFTDAIRERGIAAESNLRGFQAGRNWSPDTGEHVAEDTSSAGPALPPDLADRIEREFPQPVRDLLTTGAARAADFQDDDYARLYLDRAQRVVAADRDPACSLCREASRHLALWMTYEDIVRVADLKSRPERYARVREEVGAAPDEPVLIKEFLKPGPDELAAVLPEKLGRRLRQQRHRLKWMSFSLRLGSHTVVGHRLLRLLAGCRRWRRGSLRWDEEQGMIDRWLDAVCHAAARSPDLAREAVLCAGLNKGYGDTFTRGRGNFLRILETVIEPALAGGSDPDAAERVRSARAAALRGDDGAALDTVLLETASHPRIRPEEAGADEHETPESNQTDNPTERRIAQ